jgi:phage-related baseplate assembly protein
VAGIGDAGSKRKIKIKAAISDPGYNLLQHGFRESVIKRKTAPAAASAVMAQTNQQQI